MLTLLVFEQLAPELIWGIVSRGIAATYLIVFLSLRPQVLALAGRNGILPITEALSALERDCPTWKRFVYFPTLLWVSASDRALRALVWLGIAASVSILIGGPQTPWAFGVCYIVFLSLDRAMTLIYPWDALLLEAGFLAALLPATQLLPALGCVSAPNAPTAWAFRLLVFRVLFGFGKAKFIGTKALDQGFLRGFLATQPLPSPIGWYAQKLPMGLLKVGLLGLFLVEIVLPFAVFVPGPLASLAALSAIGLMLCIWLTGNYGHFNLLLIVLVVSWFDHATARQLSLDSLVTPVGGVIVAHTLLAIIVLPLDTWCSFTWTLWPAWRRLHFRPMTWTIAVARWLTPFRIVHPYGVFPAKSWPTIRITPVTEVSWNDLEWFELTHPYYPTRESSAPRFCAPHHERFDQAVVYEGIGLNEMSVNRFPMGRWDPYGHGGVSAPQRFIQRVLAGTAPGNRFYDRSLERQRGAPKSVRVRTHILEPTTRAERAVSGRWWKRTLIGPHFPAQSLAPAPAAHALPPPELWHFEDVVWLERSRLGRAMHRVARGEDPHRLIGDGAPELDSVVDQFWSEFVPWAGSRARDSFAGLRQDVEAMRATYGRERLYSFERIAGRYAAMLFARLEPLFNRKSVRASLQLEQPELGVPSLYELRLLTHQIVAEGRAEYDAVIAEPGSARVHAERASMFTGHTFQALFRYEWLVFQSQKLRLFDVLEKVEGRPQPSERQRAALEKLEATARRWFGALAVAEFLKTQFLEDEHVLDIAERYPRFAFTPEGEIVPVEQPAPESFAPRDLTDAVDVGQ